MRMTLRCFKDRDANVLETYAGTGSKVSQRIVVSEGVINGWTLTAIDIKKAFLKGVTYSELKEACSEPARDMNFDWGEVAVAILRTCPGYADFGPTMNKPGTGCKGAPRAFAMQLAQATNHRFGAMSTLYDEPLIVRHDENDVGLLGFNGEEETKDKG